jgi:hypothetical protein
MAVTRLAFAPGRTRWLRPEARPLLQSFGSNFQAEDVFATYLMPEFG